MLKTSFTAVLILVLGFTTVWFWAQANQHAQDYEASAKALASTEVHLHAATSALTRAEAQLSAQDKVLKACRDALTSALRASNLASQASILQTRGGPARAIAAGELLSRAIAVFKQVTGDVATCRGGTG